MSKFKTRQGVVIDDLRQYVLDWMVDKPEVELFVGCDSQEYTNTIDYAVSVCIYEVGKGGHVISKRTTHALTSNNNMRLWEEVNKSIEVAEELKDLGKKITIHVDYNVNPKFKSNELYEAGIGYARSMGYEAAGKPDAWAASKVADKAVR